MITFYRKFHICWSEMRSTLSFFLQKNVIHVKLMYYQNFSTIHAIYILIRNLVLCFFDPLLGFELCFNERTFSWAEPASSRRILGANAHRDGKPFSVDYVQAPQPNRGNEKWSALARLEIATLGFRNDHAATRPPAPHLKKCQTWVWTWAPGFEVSRLIT